MFEPGERINTVSAQKYLDLKHTNRMLHKQHDELLEENLKLKKQLPQHGSSKIDHFEVRRYHGGAEIFVDGQQIQSVTGARLIGNADPVSIEIDHFNQACQIERTCYTIGRDN